MFYTNYLFYTSVACINKNIMLSGAWDWRDERRFICVNTHASSLCLCLLLRLAVCVTMTVWVSCHNDWLCATVFLRVCWCMSSALCLIKPASHRHSILEVSFPLTSLDALRVTNSILYLFCLPASRLSYSFCLCLTLIPLLQYTSRLFFL